MGYCDNDTSPSSPPLPISSSAMKKESMMMIRGKNQYQQKQQRIRTKYVLLFVCSLSLSVLVLQGKLAGRANEFAYQNLLLEHSINHHDYRPAPRANSNPRQLRTRSEQFNDESISIQNHTSDDSSTPSRITTANKMIPHLLPRPPTRTIQKQQERSYKPRFLPGNWSKG